MGHEHARGAAECRAIFARLSEYLDHELDPELCASVDAHMDGCAPCRAFLESLRRTVAALQEVESPPLPDALRRRVIDAYHKLREDLAD